MLYNAYADQKEEFAGMQLVSCGHIFAKPGREIHRPEGREDWLLFYVAKESETFYLEKTVVAPAGSFILFAPGEKQHHQYTGSKTAEFYYVHFRCDALPMETALETSRIYHLPFKRQVCDAFEELMEETLNKQPFYERLCLMKLLQLLVFLERETVQVQNPQKENFDRIAGVLQQMNRNYERDLSLGDYAQMCNMSKYHFLRIFREITGSTPLEYRNQIRLQHAAQLLEEEKRSVEEVGAMVGYASASYFSSAFKNKYGLSPKQYQREKH